MNPQLAQDHTELHKLLGALQSALHSGNAKEIHQSLDLFWARLAVHIRAEHLALFPAIVRVAESSGADTQALTDVQSAITELRTDHDFFMRQLSRVIASVRGSLLAAEGELGDDQLANMKARIAAVANRLLIHNKLEEQGIYLWAVNLLNEQEQSDLAARVQHELATMPPRFVQNDLSDYLATD